MDDVTAIEPSVFLCSGIPAVQVLFAIAICCPDFQPAAGRHPAIEAINVPCDRLAVSLMEHLTIRFRDAPEHPTISQNLRSGWVVGVVGRQGGQHGFIAFRSDRSEAVVFVECLFIRERCQFVVHRQFPSGPCGRCSWFREERPTPTSRWGGPVVQCFEPDTVVMANGTDGTFEDVNSREAFARCIGGCLSQPRPSQISTLNASVRVDTGVSLLWARSSRNPAGAGVSVIRGGWIRGSSGPAGSRSPSPRGATLGCIPVWLGTSISRYARP